MPIRKLINYSKPKWKLSLTKKIIGEHVGVVNLISEIGTFDPTKDNATDGTTLVNFSRLATVGSIAIVQNSKKKQHYEMFLSKEETAKNISQEKIIPIISEKLKKLKLNSAVEKKLLNLHPMFLDYPTHAFQILALKENVKLDTSNQVFLSPKANGDISIRVINNCYTLSDIQKFDKNGPQKIVHSDQAVLSIDSTITISQGNAGSESNAEISIEKINIIGFENIPKTCTTSSFQKNVQNIKPSLFGKIKTETPPQLLEEVLNDIESLQRISAKPLSQFEEANGFKILMPENTTQKKPRSLSAIFFQTNTSKVTEESKKNRYLNQIKNSLTGVTIFFKEDYIQLFSTLKDLCEDISIINYDFLNQLNPTIKRKLHQTLVYALDKINKYQVLDVTPSFLLLVDKFKKIESIISSQSNQKSQIEKEKAAKIDSALIQSEITPARKTNDTSIQEIKNSFGRFTNDYKTIIKNLFEICQSDIPISHTINDKLTNSQKIQLSKIIDIYIKRLEKEKGINFFSVKDKLINIKQSLLGYNSHKTIKLNEKKIKQEIANQINLFKRDSSKRASAIEEFKKMPSDDNFVNVSLSS